MNASPSVWPALLAFVAVIALIPAVLWMLKRLQTGGASGQRSIVMLGGLPLGPRERLVVVQTQGRRWLIGVTAQSISTIAELDADASTEPEVMSASPVQGHAGDAANRFSELLGKLKKYD